MQFSAMVATLGVIFTLAVRTDAKGLPADVDYLLRLRRALPAVIVDAPEHGIDLDVLLRQRERVRGNLAGFERPDHYVTIEIDDVGLRPLVKYDPVPDALDRLSTSFRNILATLPTDLEGHRRELLARVRSELADPSIDLLRFALWSLDRHDPRAESTALDDQDLDAFRTASALKRRLRLLEEAIGWKHVEHVPGPFHEIRSRIRDGLFQTHRTAEPHVSDRVVLAEMHPDLAVLKGLIGGDCTSRCCFGYPYAPLERVFAALDGTGDILGYAAMTRTEVAGRAVYYVNCINGRRIGAHRTVMILEGLATQLHGAVTRLGVPAAETLGANFNFPEIRAVVRKLVEDAPPLLQTFPDCVARYRIQSETADHLHHYEAIYRNEVVRLLPPSALGQVGFVTRVVEGSRFAALDPGETTAREYITAVLEAIGARQFRLAKKLWAAANGDAGTIAKLITEVTNVRRLPEEDYVTRMRGLLAPYDLGAFEDFIARHPAIFTIGRLVSAHAMAPLRRARTMRELLTLLGRQRFREPRGFWPALDRFLAELDDEERSALIDATLGERRRAKKTFRPNQLYQIRSEEVYDDLLRTLGCEVNLTGEMR